MPNIIMELCTISKIDNGFIAMEILEELTEENFVNNTGPGY